MNASRYGNRLADKMMKAMERMKESVDSDLAVIMQEDAKNAFNDVIDQFYEEYTPTMYKRNNGGMYDLFKISQDEDGYYASLNSDDLNFDESRRPKMFDVPGFQEYLFNIVINRGYHGGADKIDRSKVVRYGEHPDYGTPYYRTGEYFQRWGREAYNSGGGALDRLISSGDDAPESGENTPNQRFKEALDKLKTDKYPGLMQDLIKKYSTYIRDAYQ